MGSKATREIAPHIEKHGRDAVLAKIEKHSFFEPNTGCQLWAGPSVTGGYGTTHVNSTTFLAHRVNYVLHNGEIPAGLTLDHLCKQTCCINPLHLEAVTMKENTMRGTSFSRVNAEKTHCPSGHAYDKANTFINKMGRRECRKCMNTRSLARYHNVTKHRNKNEQK